MRERGKMAKKKRIKGRAVPSKKLAFSKKNWYVFLGGIITIILGFFALSKGSITIAPILLVLGYCVVIPLAILTK